MAAGCAHHPRRRPRAAVPAQQCRDPERQGHAAPRVPDRVLRVVRIVDTHGAGERSGSVRGDPRVGRRDVHQHAGLGARRGAGGDRQQSAVGAGPVGHRAGRRVHGAELDPAHLVHPLVQPPRRRRAPDHVHPVAVAHGPRRHVHRVPPRQPHARAEAPALNDVQADVRRGAFGSFGEHREAVRQPDDRRHPARWTLEDTAALGGIERRADGLPAGMPRGPRAEQAAAIVTGQGGAQQRVGRGRHHDRPALLEQLHAPRIAYPAGPRPGGTVAAGHGEPGHRLRFRFVHHAHPLPVARDQPHAFPRRGVGVGPLGHRHAGPRNGLVRLPFPIGGVHVGHVPFVYRGQAGGDHRPSGAGRRKLALVPVRVAVEMVCPHRCPPCSHDGRNPLFAHA